MVTWVVCAHLVAQRDFGALTLLYNSALTVGALAAFGVGVTTTRYVAMFRSLDPARAGRIIRLSAIVSAVSGGVLATLLVVFARPVAIHFLGEPGLAGTVALASGLVLLNASNTYQTGTLAGLEAFRDIAGLSFWTGGIAAGITVAATYLAGIRGMLFGLLLGQAASWLFYHILLRRRCADAGIDVRGKGWWRERSVLFGFSVPAVLTSALLSPVAVLTQYWLSRCPDGLVQVALFGAADRWRQAILFFPTSLFQSVLPILSDVAKHGIDDQSRKIVRFNVLIAMGIVGISAAVCPLIADWVMSVFGRSYRAGGPVLTVLCLAAIPQAMNSALGQAVVLKSMWVRFGFDVLLFGVLAGSAFFLVPRIGATGLAGAYALANFVTTTCLFVRVRRYRLI